MSDAKREIAEKIANAEEELAAAVKRRAEADKAVTEAEARVEERKKAASARASDEGRLREKMGDLKKMRDAFHSVSEGTGDV